MSSNTAPGSHLPPPRRGPHPLVALAAYTTLIVVAVVFVFGLTSLGRAIDRFF